MHFRILGLDPAPFLPMFGKSNELLAALGVQRCSVDAEPGYPDRIALRDGAVGETMLLMNYVHQPADTPYRASHAIFVCETASAAYDRTDEIPLVLARRPLSLRGFDAAHAMQDAALVEGHRLHSAIAAMLRRPEIAYLHAHYAVRGCYAARVERAPS